MKLTKDYKQFFAEIKSRIRQAQYTSLLSVNKELIGLYWDIGQSIHEKQKAGWGKAIVETLAAELQKDFPGTRGYSSGNLWYMAQFYSEYAGNTILESMIREIGWTHNLIILKTDQERQFYIMAIMATKKFGWTVRVLEQIADRLDQFIKAIQNSEKEDKNE